MEKWINIKYKNPDLLFFKADPDPNQIEKDSNQFNKQIKT